MGASLANETLEAEWVQAVKAMWVELPLEESWRVCVRLLGTPALPCTLKQQQDNSFSHIIACFKEVDFLNKNQFTTSLSRFSGSYVL